MDLTERLKAVRGTLTQAEFAQKINLHKNSLGRYERGESLPDMEAIANICLNFGISPQWLVLGEGDMRAVPPFSAVAQADAAMPKADESVPPPHASEATQFCPLCQELRAELATERQERRELTTENRKLWNENAAMREDLAYYKANQPKKKDGTLRESDNASPRAVHRTT